MPMLGVMFQADPEKAAASLAGVFLELLLQKDCYLRYNTCQHAVFRIRIGSGFNLVSGSGIRRPKMTHKNRKNK
jgi:hypothetical protein